MVNIRQISRFKAAGVHLGLSAAIATLTVTLMLFVWYPPPLFQAMGGTELLILIVGVDVIVGPLITLIVFDVRKKSLALDLAVIALLQLAALGYGVYAMHSGRPVFGVFVENRIVIVPASGVDDESLSKAKRPEFRSLPLAGPQWVFADPPDDPKEQESIAFASLAGMGAQNLPQHFVPISERSKEIIAAARSLQLLSKRSPEDTRLLTEALLREGLSEEQARFVPVLTRQRPLIALIDGRDGRVTGILAIDPRASLQGSGQ